MIKQKKIDQLGMNPSTAAGALKKELMFHMAQKCGMDACHQCGDTIETSKELSVEHKIPWLDSDDPVGLFFDLDNVAFSHLSCNIGAARSARKLPEGVAKSNALECQKRYRQNNKEKVAIARRKKYERTGK